MKGLWERNTIDFVEKNVHGAWVIYGAIGIRHYYYYTKKEAMQRYRDECRTHGPIVCQIV